MLGFITSDTRGATDLLLAEIADVLRARGLLLAGAVQENIETRPGDRCDMDLRILSGADVIRISQNLGRGALGCRLDPAGLEQAVGLVEGALAQPVDLLIVNKFGKQEIDGRGFRPLIGQALAADIPVLTAVNRTNRDHFDSFVHGLADEIPATRDAVLDWCGRVMNG